MGDPITTGILVGAAMGGGGAALKGQDPLKGALIGGATGGIGGGISGGAMGGSSSPFSLGSILNGIGTNAAAGGDPAKGLAMNAAALAGSGGGFGGGGYGSIGTAGQTAGGASGGMFSGMSMPSTITGLGKDISALNTFMNQNPVTTRLGMETASSLMQEPQVQYAQPGQVQRGQIQPMDYMSLLNPQGQYVQQPISLL
jgi:hypothetical protein